ncbi:MAG: Panacea domain-containing protein [Bacteroidota bacterium]|nr:Panacea domain-containing protein [Bacteroidota bacterium]
MDKRKAEAMAEYLLFKLGGKNNYMYILKIIFFADRYHLRKYLRPVSSDEYYAMKGGAVASYLYNIFKGDVKAKNIKHSKDDKYDVELISNKIDISPLSPSDIEAIDFALSKFSKLGNFDLSKITHAYPEWKRYAKRFQTNPRGREVMFFEDFFDNASKNDPIFKKCKFADPFPPISPDEKEKILDAIKEYCTQTV